MMFVPASVAARPGGTLEFMQRKFDAFIERWPSIPEALRPDELARHVGFAPRHEHRTFLLDAFEEFERNGYCGFGNGGRAKFSSLPNVVTVYRGTHEAEARNEDFGLFWETNRLHALWYARRGTSWAPRPSWETPCLLTATVDRRDLRIVTDAELMALPRAFTVTKVEALDEEPAGLEGEFFALADRLAGA